MSTTSDRGLFVWHEVSSNDVAVSEDFYTRLIGWRSQPWAQNSSYKLLLAKRELRAGVWPITEEPLALAAPPHWLCYIGTPDVDATVRQAVELGGKVIVPAYNIPRVGRMAHLQDPQGALFAISARHERTRYQEPEAGDFSWHELLTTNLVTAFDFYSKLFGWEKLDAVDMGPQGTYQMFGAGGHRLGGMFAPGGVPGGPAWLPYAMVRDSRRTAELARTLGATITLGPMEVPGGDWVFTGLDPQSAAFAVHSRDPKHARETKHAKGTKTPGSTKRVKKRAAPAAARTRRGAKHAKGRTAAKPRKTGTSTTKRSR